MPEQHDRKLLTPELLTTAFSFEDGFHRADWPMITDWIGSRILPEDLDAAWNEIVRAWLGHMRNDLGGNYSVVESRQTFLLSDQSAETARWILEYAGRAVTTIKQHLGEVAWKGGIGKDVVMVFAEQDDYYQYVSYYCPDGEQAGSGGMSIHAGYTHIAFPWFDELEAANVIIHELTHDCLAHLDIPAWLNEGMAVTLEKLVAPSPKGLGQSSQDSLFSAAIAWRPPVMWDELAERHFAFWNEENIQAFWAGTSFKQPGESNALSYSLGEVLLQLMSERTNRKAFLAFLESAKWEDAGQLAAAHILDTDLGQLAGTFLGPGDWRPNKKSMEAQWSAAGIIKPDSKGQL